MIYIVTIDAPGTINPATPDHLQSLLANPANKIFVKSVRKEEKNEND